MTGKPPAVEVAELTLDAIAKCEAARQAISRAMSTANNLSVVVPGWQWFQRADAALAAVVDEHSPARILATNEVRVHGGDAA